jgi:hypothetical protein
MSVLFNSSLLIFTIIKTILSTFFFTVSDFYKNLVKWALTEIESSVAGTITLDRECPLGVRLLTIEKSRKHDTKLLIYLNCFFIFWGIGLITNYVV